MSLLKDIQTALLEGAPIGPILLKLRFLASRLGSDQLEQWVKYEAEGYPLDAELPNYRKIPIAYKGTFSGPFGAGIQNAPIPSYLIQKHAGIEWTYNSVRESVSGVDTLIEAGKNGSLHISAANLILVMQGNVYDGYACNDISGVISTSSLVEIQSNVRAKVLELTIQLEKTVPVSVEIGVLQAAKVPAASEQQEISHITNNIVHGNLTNISNSGHSNSFEFTISVGNRPEVVSTLVDNGVAEQDAQEFANILASEGPEGSGQPFGPKAKAWLSQNIGKALNGTWKAGITVATQVITEAALRYYGLK